MSVNILLVMVFSEEMFLKYLRKMSKIFLLLASKCRKQYRSAAMSTGNTKVLYGQKTVHYCVQSLGLCN